MIYSDNHLSGKTFLVTGASSGIGKATATLIASCGGRLIASGRDESKLDQFLKETGGTEHIISPRNLSDADDVAEWVSGLAKQYGPLSGIFHSAGMELIRPARMIKQKHIDELLGSSLYAGFGLARAVCQKNVVVDGASIVFMSSVAGQTGQMGMTAYSACKAGIDGLVRSLACELSQRRIRVNSIASGAVATAMHDRWLQSASDEAKHGYQSSYLLGYGHADDVANAAVFLLSDLSKWITGTVMLVDGGFTVR
jgi:NAD(P)-dependent dehydrogenase (short-subunit alcohol dehydrogenase family)